MGHLQFLTQNTCLFAATTALAAIGAVFVGIKSLSFFKTLLDVYVLKGISLKNFGAGTGAWAIVTGATDGIGKEFALQLAEKKFNVVLVSRTQSKLDAIAQEIGEKYNVETKTFLMDFPKGSDQDFSNLGKLINSIRVGVLVNNVGVNHAISIPFADETDKGIGDIIEVNIKGTLKLTRLVLPQLRTNRSGLMINVGSIVGLVPNPYQSVYSASKSFLSSWSQAIGAELAEEGIVVEYLNTFFVATSMNKLTPPSHLTPLPKTYVASVLSKVGLACGTNTPFASAGYPPHGILNWVVDNLFTNQFWVNQSFAIQKDLRARVLRSLEEEAAANRKSD